MEADPDLERSMTICQDIGKVLALYPRLYDEKKAASTAQTTLDKIFTKKTTLILNVSNVLNCSVLNKY